MGNFINSIINHLRLTDDEYEDEYDDLISEIDEKDTKKSSRNEERTSNGKSSRSKAKYDEDEYEKDAPKISVSTETRTERAKRMEPNRLSKVVPIRTTNKGFEVCIMKPTTFEDSQDICDMLLDGRAAVINLEGFDVELAQRIMDFISGAVYAMNGKLHQISSYIFIISPDTVDISGDYLDLIPADGFGAPTFSKDF